MLPEITDLLVSTCDGADVEVLPVWREAPASLCGQPLENRIRDQEVLLGRHPVLEQAVGNDDVRAVELLDVAESLPREPAVMDDELDLEDADVGAGIARAGRDRLHVAEPAVKRDEGFLEGLDHVLR